LSKLRTTLNRNLAFRGYRIVRTHNPNFFELFLLRYLEGHGRTLRFIQIGANDGQRFDPIHEFASSPHFEFFGLAVEPVPRFYRALKQIYRNQPGIKAVNAAIHNTWSEATLYVVGEQFDRDVPEWALGTASFSKEHVIKPEVPEEYIEAITVPCVSLVGLMDREGFRKLDLLQIDTEGYDGEILRSIDFTKMRPAMIHFEHGMGDGVMTRSEVESLIELLNQQGYQVLLERYDALAFLPYEFARN